MIGDVKKAKNVIKVLVTEKKLKEALKWMKSKETSGATPGAIVSKITGILFGNEYVENIKNSGKDMNEQIDAVARGLASAAQLLSTGPHTKKGSNFCKLVKDSVYETVKGSVDKKKSILRYLGLTNKPDNDLGKEGWVRKHKDLAAKASSLDILDVNKLKVIVASSAVGVGDQVEAFNEKQEAAKRAEAAAKAKREKEEQEKAKKAKEEAERKAKEAAEAKRKAEEEQKRKDAEAKKRAAEQKRNEQHGSDEVVDIGEVDVEELMAREEAERKAEEKRLKDLSERAVKGKLNDDDLRLLLSDRNELHDEKERETRDILYKDLRVLNLTPSFLSKNSAENVVDSITRLISTVYSPKDVLRLESIQVPSRYSEVRDGILELLMRRGDTITVVDENGAYAARAMRADARKRAQEGKLRDNDLKIMIANVDDLLEGEKLIRGDLLGNLKILNLNSSFFEKHTDQTATRIAGISQNAPALSVIKVPSAYAKKGKQLRDMLGQKVKIVDEKGNEY